MPPIRRSRRIRRMQENSVIPDEAVSFVERSNVSPESPAVPVVAIPEVNAQEASVSTTIPNGTHMSIPLDNRPGSAFKRLQAELLKIRREPMENCTLEPEEDNIFCWKGAIIGPPDTPYADGVFRLHMYFTERYPFKAPRVMFDTRIFHSNIHRDGTVCLNILDETWSPTISLPNLLLSLQVLLANANPDDPMEPYIAVMYKQDRPKHDAQARSWTLKYAQA